MTLNDIKTLIASDESRTLELKKTTGELKDGMHTACAFLNADGGWLIFGVAPKSLKILGQEVSDSTKREIAQAISGLEPAVDVSVKYIDVPERPGNKVIAMHFEGWIWGNKPYTYHGCPYYKVENTTKVMPREMYDERVRAHKPQHYVWECIVADHLTIGDLNEDLIRGCVRLGVERGRMPETSINDPIRDILSKWKLLSNGIPTNGAALLFSNKIDEYPQFELKMARFIGTNKNEFRDNQRVEGNFFGLLNAGMAFLFKHLSLSGKITGLQREEHLEVPYVALREALINALSHRQWEKYNLTISLAIYDDRIEIANPGVLPNQLTVDTLKLSHESFPYNENVAKVLYHSTYLERWGSGVKRIVDACVEQGLPEPVWRANAGFITVTFQRPSHASAGSGQAENKTQADTTQKSGAPVVPRYSPSTPPVPPQYSPSTPLVKILIEKATAEFVSIGQLADLCGLKDIKYFRENYLNPALEDGAIEPLYPNQPRHPKQKFHLTKAAIEWKTKNLL